MRFSFLVALLAVTAGLVTLPGGADDGAIAGAGSTLARPADPVILTGADVDRLRGFPPDDVVAFAYDGGWQQIPVQVDERAVKDFAQVYGTLESSGELAASGQAFAVPEGITSLFYTDAGTFTGPDPDPRLDANDEIVFMAKDAGGAAPPSVAEPAGVVPGTGIEVAVSDPLDGGAGHVYLFRSDGSLTPDAGASYVTYDFDLLSGDYLTTYHPLNGPNPEDSTVTTPYYSNHFADRWISDELRIMAGAATGVDILDRHRNLFAPGFCGRSEDTFADGEGAFVVNKSGPVRALRSYVGANSGPLTQRDHFFYEQRQDIEVALRVHAIPSVMDFFDYSPDASGMTYYNSLNTGGVTIDGAPDAVTPGLPSWELVTGAQGSLVIVGAIETTIAGLNITSYYSDDLDPDVEQCTGDDAEYSASGLWITSNIPCTDPALDCTKTLTGTRTIYFGEPGLTTADAAALQQEASTPLVVSTGPYKAGLSDTDGDTIPNASDADDDNDGCTDEQELGTNPALGGLRDPHDVWDFFDVPTGSQLVRDGAVVGPDIAAIVARFGSTGDPTGDPLSTPLPPPSYHTAYDRGGSKGPSLWNLLPPDGAIVGQDIAASVGQFGHSCA